jgi:hypothetical protein
MHTLYNRYEACSQLKMPTSDTSICAAGFAGVAGYAWVTVLHLWLGLRFDHVLLAANASAIAWL